uniref:thiamine phosphate synthase n=1 Tax=Pararhizobium sp. IMCC3301 TaxID=3067904 RepID=UPI0027428557|nr:thiamine phosphate synthase [Pararhizobium sp. IMCC3301]
MRPVDLTLYGILDPQRSLGRDLDTLADAAIAGGCTLLQLRDKLGSTRDMLSHAKAIKSAIAGRVPFLINDRVDVALAIGADGVHLGQDDMPVAEARRLMGPGAIIGLSVKTRQQAMQLPRQDLSYVCIGGVFETRSKDNPTSIGIDGWVELAALCRTTMAEPIPVGAIAGIDRNSAFELVKAGADGVALISALFMEDDVRGAAAAFRDTIQRARS